MILVMDHGEIVEKGTHNELLKIEDGTYKALIARQLQKQDLSPSPPKFIEEQE